MFDYLQLYTGNNFRIGRSQSFLKRIPCKIFSKEHTKADMNDSIVGSQLTYLTVYSSSRH